jgi:cystathionine beta-lyase
VALSDGAIFGENGQGHVRLNFGTSRKILRQGLDRMSGALNVK